MINQQHLHHPSNYWMDWIKGTYLTMCFGNELKLPQEGFFGQLQNIIRIVCVKGQNCVFPRSPCSNHGGRNTWELCQQQMEILLTILH